MKKDMRNLECIILIEKGQSKKGFMLSESTIVTFWKGKTMKMIETSVVLGDMGRRDEQVGHRILGQWKYSERVMMGTCDNAFANAHWMYSAKSESSVNYGFGEERWSVSHQSDTVMMMCQSRLITCNQYTNLVGDVENGVGGNACVEQAHGKICVFPFDFAINLQLL